MAPTRKAYATADEQQRLLLQFLIGNSLVWGKNINPLSGDNSYNIPLEGDGLAESEFDKELYENVTFGNIVDNLPRNQMIPNLDDVLNLDIYKQLPEHHIVSIKMLQKHSLYSENLRCNKFKDLLVDYLFLIS